MWELTGSTNDQCPLVYLSDGGHFENLGVYEMVLRRCRYIVVSDGGCDPKYTFEDLGNAIRKIRTDLGIPIDIEKMYMFPRTADGKYEEGRYVATARIRYSAIDATRRGWRRPVSTGCSSTSSPVCIPRTTSPRTCTTMRRLRRSSRTSRPPISSSGESQFESYRALGRHAINEICGNYVANNGVFPVATCFSSVAEFALQVAGKAGRDESFDVHFDKNAPNFPLAFAISATPKARLVIR